MSLPLPVTAERRSNANCGFATKPPFPTTASQAVSAVLSGLAALGQATSVPFLFCFSTCVRQKVPSSDVEKAPYSEHINSSSFTSPSHHISLPTPPKPAFLPSLTIFRPKPAVKSEADVTVTVRTIWSAKVLSATIKPKSDILDTLFEVVDKEHGYAGDLVCYHATPEDIHPLLTDRAVRWWMRFVGTSTQPECWMVPANYNPQDLYTRSIEVRYHQGSDTSEAWWETHDGKYDRPRRLSFSSLSMDEDFHFPRFADNRSSQSSHHSEVDNQMQPIASPRNSAASSDVIDVPIEQAPDAHTEADISSPESFQSNDSLPAATSPAETFTTVSTSPVNESKEDEEPKEREPERDNALQLINDDATKDDNDPHVVIDVDTWQGPLEMRVPSTATANQLSVDLLKYLGLTGGLIQLWIMDRGRWVHPRDEELQAWLTSEPENGWRAKVFCREEGSDEVLRPHEDDSDGGDETGSVDEVVQTCGEAPNEGELGFPADFVQVTVETWAGEVVMSVPMDTTVKGFLCVVGGMLEWSGTAALRVDYEGKWVYLQLDELFHQWLQTGPDQDGGILRAGVIRPEDLESKDVEAEEEDLQDEERLDCYVLAVATWKRPLEFNVPYGTSFDQVLSAITSSLDQSHPVLLFAVDQDRGFTPIVDDSSFKALAPRDVQDSRQFDCRAIPASAPCLQGDATYVIYPDQALVLAWLWSIGPEEDNSPMRPNEQDIHVAEVKAGFRDEAGELVQSYDLEALINVCGWEP